MTGVIAPGRHDGVAFDALGDYRAFDAAAHAGVAGLSC